MKAVRGWSICNKGRLTNCYGLLDGITALFTPLPKAIRHERLDKFFSAVEDTVRALPCHSQSSGQCTLGETGMAYRLEDRISEIVTSSSALDGREKWRPAA